MLQRTSISSNWRNPNNPNTRNMMVVLWGGCINAFLRIGLGTSLIHWWRYFPWEGVAYGFSLATGVAVRWITRGREGGKVRGVLPVDTMNRRHVVREDKSILSLREGNSIVADSTKVMQSKATFTNTAMLIRTAKDSTWVLVMKAGFYLIWASSYFGICALDETK